MCGTIYQTRDGLPAGAGWRGYGEQSEVVGDGRSARAAVAALLSTSFFVTLITHGGTPFDVDVH